MTESALNIDEVYRQARILCSAERVDALLYQMHLLRFEIVQDRRLTATMSTANQLIRPALFDHEQTARMMETFTPDEIHKFIQGYNAVVEAERSLVTRIDYLVGLCNHRAGFIRKLSGILAELMTLSASTTTVVEHLEQVIASLELAIAFDQEKECY